MLMLCPLLSLIYISNGNTLIAFFIIVGELYFDMIQMEMEVMKGSNPSLS